MIAGIPKPVSITYAANGANRTKRDCLSLAVRPEELVSSAKAAQASGAAVFSFTVRDDKGRYTIDPGQVKTTLDILRDATQDLVFQLELDTNLNVSVPAFCQMVRAVQPDAILVHLSQILPSDGDDKDEEAAQELLDLCEELGVGVQIALAKASDVDWFYAFRQYGVIPQSCQSLLLVLGEDGDEPASDPNDLRRYLAQLEKQNLLGKVTWSVAAFGPQETAALAIAIALGGHVAPGFAFNRYTVEGQEYASPSDQLMTFGDLAARLGRPTANKFEAKTILFGVR